MPMTEPTREFSVLADTLPLTVDDRGRGTSSRPSYLLLHGDLDRVVLVGNSLGGWIGAEIALRASPRVAGLVLLNAVGVAPTPETGAIVDPTTRAPADLLALAFHDPARGAAAFAGADHAVAAGNQAALRTYTGDAFMHDPTLHARLARLALPTLVLWGASDGVVSPAYGRHFADGIPGARFALISEAGHFPQIEQPEAVAAAMAGLVVVGS